MSEQHTQEPWRIESNPDTYTDGVHICGDANDTTNGAGICGLWIDTELSNEEQEANARRIVACVNACAGIPDSHLQSLALGALAGIEHDRISHWDKIVELQQQNAELLASCNSFRDCVLHQRWNLEDNGMTSDQINDVLNLFDTLIGDEIAKAGQL